MPHSTVQTLAKASFSILVFAFAQAASALTIKYSTNTATYVPNPAPPPSRNTRPLQLSPKGNAMNTGAIPNTRNFIYQNLIGDYAPAGNWKPVNQTTSTINEQRFDYYFGAATLSSVGGTSGLAQVHTSTDKLYLNFGSFYLDGSCSFCGSANTVSLVNSSLTGTTKFIGESPTSTPGNSILGNQNTITSSIYNIVFGVSGITGTLQYTASTNVISNPLQQFNTGIITIVTNDPIPPSPGVPGPLPVLGTGAAFGFSRRLRRQILNKANRFQGI
jgi:hypothetical protein